MPAETRSVAATEAITELTAKTDSIQDAVHGHDTKLDAMFVMLSELQGAVKNLTLAAARSEKQVANTPPHTPTPPEQSSIDPSSSTNPHSQAVMTTTSPPLPQHQFFPHNLPFPSHYPPISSQIQTQLFPNHHLPLPNLLQYQPFPTFQQPFPNQNHQFPIQTQTPTFLIQEFP